MRIRFSARARVDLFAQIDWLAERSTNAARRAADHIRIQLALLAAFPRLAPEVEGGRREAMVRFGRDGFVVRYRLDDDVVLIERIFHGRQER